MHRSLIKTIGVPLLISLVMPAGILLAKESASTNGLTSNSANWYDVEEASNLLSGLQTRAINARNAVGQNQTSETDLAWQIQALNLRKARNNVNSMGEDLLRLDEISSKLEPWQQRLIQRVTPQVHEMAYQLDAAIDTLNQYPSKDRLALTQYPNNINQLCSHANQVIENISTVTQYSRAEQKMAALNRMTSTGTGS